MEKKLYTLKNTEDPAKQDLYIKKSGKIQNFFTYFNSFSLNKWKYYTMLEQVTLRLEVRGKWKIIWQAADESGIHLSLEETFNGNVYEHKIDADSFSSTLIGFQLQPLSQNAVFISGAWYGSFTQWQNRKIGISITTFHRESYIKKNMTLLREFQNDHPWLYLQVVDNGNTLPEEKSDRFRLLHNPNFGGSGGFTRGMLEYVHSGCVDYVLLMDDDIDLDPTILERTYSLLGGLRSEFQESFLAGAMLKMENPVIQYENTACWKKIRLHSFGKNFDLTQIKQLVKNEVYKNPTNRYGAWWYCCIPINRIQKIGYPLPIFVKGDDMEYGIRNQKECLSLNGIGVWHLSFESKLSPVVKYYSDRNMLIINNFAQGCGFLTFAIAVCGRFVKRLLQFNFRGLLCLNTALVDYNQGMSGITSIPADEKMAEIVRKVNGFCGIGIFFTLLLTMVKTIASYPNTAREYRKFREDKLKDNRFWKQYLGIKE